jgi:hypothetical protein
MVAKNRAALRASGDPQTLSRSQADGVSGGVHSNPFSPVIEFEHHWLLSGR